MFGRFLEFGERCDRASSVVRLFIVNVEKNGIITLNDEGLWHSFQCTLLHMKFS